MTNSTHRNGISTLHHDSDAGVNSESNSGWQGPAVQKRTRSQLSVSDSVLRLPLSRSPLKDARRAHSKVRGTSPVSQADFQPYSSKDSQLPIMEGGGWVAGSTLVEGAGAWEMVQEKEAEEGSEDSLFSGASLGRKCNDEDSSQQTTWLTSTKKRPSPDTDAMRVLSSPGSTRHAKRAKVETAQILDRGRQHSEYHEPLRDSNAKSPARPEGRQRASSTKPGSSPGKRSSSIFPPRAQSVPLGGGNEVRAIDLASIPPSPRRSPSKGGVEIKRALSVPPPDDDPMDVDAEDNSGLLHFTNPTQFTPPHVTPMFSCTVNFATPRRPITPHSNTPFASPLSPLTPLSRSPSPEQLPGTRRLLAKKANTKPLTFDYGMNTFADHATPITVFPAADTATSIDVFQLTTHIPSQPSLAASMSRQGTMASGSAIPQSHPAGPPPTSSNSKELMPSPVPEGEDGSIKGVPPNNSDASVDFTSTPGSRSRSNALPTSRCNINGSMKPRRGAFIPQGSRRVTRSVSMKVEGTRNEHAESEGTKITSDTEGVSCDPIAMPPPTPTTPKPHPPKSVDAVTSKSKPPTAQRSTSLSNPPPDPSKLKQASLNAFIRPKPSTAGRSDSTARTSTNTRGLSRAVSLSSPSKIPLPASPLKRPPTTQTANSKPFLHSLGSTSTSGGTGASRPRSGRSLTTLSHALDKLVVPPPSRPNTSMGFVRDEGASDGESIPEDSKGKGKAKDDTSLPSTSTVKGSGTTFARPTASSLNRAATVTGIGSTATAKTRGRGGAAFGGRARGVMGIFGRAGDRASKKTSLPVVVGSPVKASGSMDDLDRHRLGAGRHKPISTMDCMEDPGGLDDEDIFVSRSAAAGDNSRQAVAKQGTFPPETLMNGGGNAVLPEPSLVAATRASDDIEHIDLVSPIWVDKGKQRTVSCSALNPASSALHALSESLSSLPHTPTPPKPKVVGTRTGLRSSTTAVGKGSPVVDSSSTAALGVNSEVQGGEGVSPSNGTVNGPGSAKKSSLKILKQCIIFVDVRTEQGDDAGSLFVDMLKGLGARIMTRLGRKCTHIVYKNGHANTLTRYRMLDPKPVVVGIAWVVECVEKRAKVDEERFKVDVDLVNVAGGNKRRRSMLPKHLIPTSPGPGLEIPMHMSSEADEEEEGTGIIDGSPSQDPDLSMRSREDDDLPPLERARRRRSILPGGQTRLVP